MLIMFPQGLITGLAKGVVGTVTKPAVGILDLLSGTAYAVRDTTNKWAFFMLLINIFNDYQC